MPVGFKIGLYFLTEAPMNKVLNFGSLNLDHVYAVDHIVVEGETQASLGYQLLAGGKGANQSVALARAGAEVYHAGRIGPEGGLLRDKLARAGVKVEFVLVGDGPTGQAIIQVDRQGRNAIVLFPGENQRIASGFVDETLARFGAGDWLLLQNEINGAGDLIRAGKRRGLRVALNPAPMTPDVTGFPLAELDLIVANEIEAEQLTGESELPAQFAALRRLCPAAELVVTLGKRGVSAQADGNETISLPALRVKAVDTTAAGDTFVGYFLAERLRGADLTTALRSGCKAAALGVTRPGAMDSIPTRAEVETWQPAG